MFEGRRTGAGRLWESVGSRQESITVPSRRSWQGSSQESIVAPSRRSRQEWMVPPSRPLPHFLTGPPDRNRPWNLHGIAMFFVRTPTFGIRGNKMKPDETVTKIPIKGPTNYTVNVRYDNTSNYWPAKVLAIDDRHMTVQWHDPQDQHATVTVPHASVRRLGVDGAYADDCSALGGSSSIKTSTSKGNGQRQ